MFSDSKKKPFQDLHILVRDWVNFEEYDYAFDDGKKLLSFTFKAHRQSNLSEIQKTIGDNFQKIQCFLMPKPGSKVEAREFKGDFNGNYSFCTSQKLFSESSFQLLKQNFAIM